MASNLPLGTGAIQVPLVETGASDLIISKLENYLIQVAESVQKYYALSFC